MTKIFVYGTLMTGYRNYKKFLDGHVISCKKAYVKNTKLYHLVNKNCPAIVEGDGIVYGEMIEIDDDKNNTILKSIDQLEKYFEESTEVMYERKMKNIYYEDGQYEQLGVYIFINNNYLINNDIILIESGDWKDFICRYCINE